MKLSFLSLAIFLLYAGGAFAEQLLPTVTDATLLATAGNKYASGELPLGDGHYVLDAPQKGFIYLCHTMNNNEGGAQAAGPWIHGNTWNILQKIGIKGNVSWPDAKFSNVIDGDQRILSGNDLPLNHTTGQFPVPPSDPAFSYDRNPNNIAAQQLRDALPLHPSYSSQPYCMGGEAGIMLTGIALFNGFDAGMRDAAAHELQDSCSGHPQRSGEYHYHSLSACIRNVSEKAVIGYALDGFPITGPMMAPGKYLTTADLDVCHGIVSEIEQDGVRRVTYHYVMTQDFPYSVSCFRAKPVRTAPSDQAGRQNHGRRPPAEAIAACEGKGRAFPCSFTSLQGDIIRGTCDGPPDKSLACHP